MSQAEVTENVSARARSTPPVGEEQQGASESGSVSEGGFGEVVREADQGLEGSFSDPGLLQGRWGATEGLSRGAICLGLQPCRIAGGCCVVN